MSTCYSTFQIPENGNWHHDENPLVLLVVGDSNFTPDLTLWNNAWLHTGCSSIFVQNSTLGKFLFCIFFSNFVFCPFNFVQFSILSQFSTLSNFLILSIFLRFNFIEFFNFAEIADFLFDFSILLLFWSFNFV